MAATPADIARVQGEIVDLRQRIAALRQKVAAARAAKDTLSKAPVATSGNAPLERILASAQKQREADEKQQQRTGEPFTPQAAQLQRLAPLFPSAPPEALAGLSQVPAATTRTQDIPDFRLRQQASIAARTAPPDQGPTIGATPEDKDFLQKAAQWIAPASPEDVGGPGAVVRNLGADKVIGGIVGAFAQAGKSVIDLAIASAPGKIPNPAVLAEASRAALEQAKGFAEFAPQQLGNAAVMAGLGPDGWNPLIEIVQRKLAGKPMRLDELREKYPTFAAAGEELVAFPAGPAMALGVAKSLLTKPTVFETQRARLTTRAAEAQREAPAPRPSEITIEQPLAVTREPAIRGPGPTPPVRPPKPVIPVEPSPVRRTAPTARAVPADEFIGLNKEGQNRIRAEIDRSPLAPARKQAMRDVHAKVVKERLHENALTIADEVNKSRRPITAEEHVSMVVKAAELSSELKTQIKDIAEIVDRGGDLTQAQARETVLRDQLDNLTEASRHGRRETARALGIGRVQVHQNDYGVVALTQRAKAVKGKPLTTAETVKLQQASERIKTLEAAAEEAATREQKFLKERERMIADKVTAHEKRVAGIVRGKKTAQQKLAAEQAKIEKELAQMGLTVRMGLDPQMAFTLGKYAVNLVRQGATSLDAVVKQVRAKYPELTDSDIYEALATRDPKRQAKARTETTKRVAELKTQGRLLNEIEKVELGIFDKKTPTPQTSLAVKTLRRRLRDLRTQAYRSGMNPERLERAVRQINELQDMLDNQSRAIRKRRPEEIPELQDMKQRMRNIRTEMRVEDQLADLNEQLRTGEFVVREKKKTTPISPQLEQKQIALKKARRRVNIAIGDLAPLTFKKGFRETANFTRTAKAMADMSGVARQGLILSVSNPKAFPRAFTKSAKSFFRENTAEQVDLNIRSHPNYYLAERAKLELTEVGEPLGKREENFSSRWAERIPGFGAVVKASERHMTTFLNMMRFEHFNRFLDMNPNATTAELTAMADWINVASGRGNFGRFAPVADAMSSFVFAPKFALSRVQTPFMVFKHWKEPRVRKAIATDYAKTAAFGAATLAIAKIAGAQLEGDPDSPDWGKIRIGAKDDPTATRIDIWAGMQQPMRVIARIGLGFTNRFEDVEPLELIGRFSSYKLGPIVGLPLEFARGETIVGETVSPTETAARALTPLVAEDVLDAFKQAGLGRAVAVAPTVFFGFGASTFEDSERTTRNKIRDLKDKGDMAGALRLKLRWNQRHPSNRIVDVPTSAALRLKEAQKKLREQLQP